MASDIHIPERPCCVNWRGVPISSGVPVVKAKRRPLMKSSGAGWPSRFTSSGL